VSTCVSTALVLLLLGCQSPADNSEQTPLLTPPALATESDSSGISASAELVPVQIANLSAGIAGTVSQVSARNGDVVTAGAPLLTLDVPNLEAAVAAAAADLRSARAYADLQRFSHKELNSAGRYVYLTGPPELRQAADARVARAEAALLLAQQELARGTVSAPFDGTVVETDVSPGEWVEGLENVITFADLSRFELQTTDLDEMAVNKITIGQPVEIHLDAFGNSISGVVRLISPRGAVDGGEVFFTVIIEPSQLPAGARWGMTATVTFH
jgi:HlyD family secretion protein